MDFGDILDKWEDEQKKIAKAEKERQKKLSQKPAGSGKKLNAPTKQEKEAMAAIEKKAEKPQIKKITTNKKDFSKKVNPMEQWLRLYGVVDKDKEAEKIRQKEEMQDVSVLRAMACEAEIDLHGLTRDEAWSRLDSFIGECQRRKLQKVLIIHGKGNHSGDSPVLAGIVRSFIERDYRLGQSGHPDKNEGGRGATWVIIKRKSIHE